MDIRQGIIESAQALGMPPADLATIISFETGGTFDPQQVGGVRTKYGTHRGFIQFGEPQAAKYGIDFSTPESAINTQLGANGAVVRYFKDHGYQPGMDFTNTYSIVNAGAAGRTGAIDRGTSVSQKVNSPSMQEHAKKGTALLGGQFTPTLGQSTTTSAAAAAAAARNPDLDAWAMSRGSGLADTLSSSVGRQTSGARGESSSRAPNGNEGETVLPTLDYATAAPEAVGPVLPAERLDLSPLAELFKVRDIGQAGTIDPLTQQPKLLHSRRTYG